MGVVKFTFPIFNFYARNYISGEAEARAAKFGMQVREYIKC